MKYHAMATIDWFVPRSVRSSKSEFGRARTFVFTHLLGPIMSAPIVLYLYAVDPDPVIPCMVITFCLLTFLLLPFWLKRNGQLQSVGLVSYQTLSFVTLFGSYFYGGVSSPFLPWLLVALLLGFFYLDRRPGLVLGLAAFNGIAFASLIIAIGAPERVSFEALRGPGLVSLASAVVYISWMAVYYGYLLSTESEVQREVEHHRTISSRLQKTKELAEKSNRETAIFLAKMSHELRTPLNAVIGFSELLLEDAKCAGQDHRIQDLIKINAAGKHLLSLLTEVLDLSSIDARREEAHISQFELTLVVEEAVASVLPLIGKQHNRLKIETDSRLGQMSSDPTKLRQILVNLLSNAAKFTKFGEITLRALRIANPVGDWVEIEVLDTGVGMSEDDIAQLFEDFGQTQSGRAAGAAGTGLGLAISQKFAGILGGAISVDSRVGLGSGFKLRIPAHLRGSELAEAA